MIKPADFVPFERGGIESSIPARFGAMVERAPGAIAIRSGGSSIRYDTLAATATRIARAIASALGPRPEPVALLLDQGADLIAATLAVLESGHFYVPLDTRHPDHSLAGAIADCGARCLVTDRAGHARALRLAPVVIDMDRLPEIAGSACRRPGPDDLAYIYYTSGTTGRAKGVTDTHRNVLHNVMRYTNALFISPSDRLTLLQAPAFSGAVSSMFGALLNGATCCPYDVHYDGVPGIVPWLEREHLTMYHSVPILFRHALRSATPRQQLSALRVVRLEGDRAAAQDFELFRAHAPAGAVLSHGLGATECGLVCRALLDHSTPIGSSSVPVGYSLEDMCLRLQDDVGQEVAWGSIGELVVESAFLSPGYHGNPDATAAAFRPGRAEGTRAYLTGDMARFRDDGSLELLGRKTFQPRLRGQRIDVEGIERALVDTGLALEAVVDVRGARNDEGQLVAWFVPTSHPPPNVSVLRRQLSRLLSPHMVPARFVAIAALPLTEHRKLDRQALSDPDRSRPQLDTPYLAPVGPLSIAIAAAFAESLALDQAGVRDDFFELGGDSLSATLLLERLHEQLGVELPTHAFFAAPTVEGLARVIATISVTPRLETPEQRSPVVMVQRGGALTPFFFLHAEHGGDGFYCLKVARELGAERPFYGVAPLGREPGPAPAAIETIAASQLESIREVQPRGPYLLGGFCSGAVVAWELACQLRERGESVVLLVLVEAPALNRRKWWRAIHAVAGLAATLRGAGAETRLGLVLAAAERVQRGGQVRWRDVSRAWRWLAGPRRPLPIAPSGGPQKDAIASAYQRALSGYLPRRFDGRVVSLRAAEELSRTPVDCWRRRASVFEAHDIPGDHDSCIIAHARELAAPLQEALASASINAPGSPSS